MQGLHVADTMMLQFSFNEHLDASKRYASQTIANNHLLTLEPLVVTTGPNSSNMVMQLLWGLMYLLMLLGPSRGDVGPPRFRRRADTLRMQVLHPVHAHNILITDYHAHRSFGRDHIT
jgi:hypothetical protein